MTLAGWTATFERPDGLTCHRLDARGDTIESMVTFIRSWGGQTPASDQP